MKMKRIIAVALAFCMLASSLLSGVSNEAAYAYAAEQVLDELKGADVSDKVVDTESVKENDNIASKEEMEELKENPKADI